MLRGKKVIFLKKAFLFSRSFPRIRHLAILPPPAGHLCVPAPAAYVLRGADAGQSQGEERRRRRQGKANVHHRTLIFCFKNLFPVNIGNCTNFRPSPFVALETGATLLRPRTG